jgi:hypothetical protein
MPSVNSAVSVAFAIVQGMQLTDFWQVFHAYAYGTAFWYGLRGMCRVYDPIMVIGCTLPTCLRTI